MRKNTLRNFLFFSNNLLSCTGGMRIRYFTNMIYPIKLRNTNKLFYTTRFLKNNGTHYFSTEKNQLHILSKEQIEEKVVTVLKKYLPNDADIKYNEDLEKNKTKDNRNWDFLDTVEFLIDIESEFNITIPDETADNIKTVQELLDYLSKLKVKEV